MTELKKVLMQRDGMSDLEAEEAIASARAELNHRLSNEEDCEDICQDLFGLEPDYIFDLMD